MKNLFTTLLYNFSQYDRWFYIQTLLFLGAIITLLIVVLSTKKQYVIILTFLCSFYVIFHYTFAVIPSRARDRIQIIRFEKIDLIPVANHGYHIDLFANFPAFVNNTENIHKAIVSQTVKFDSEYFGRYHRLITVKTDEVQLKFYKPKM